MKEMELVEEICSACSGSGEGQWDDTLCWRCKGWGVEYRFRKGKEEKDTAKTYILKAISKQNSK